MKNPTFLKNKYDLHNAPEIQSAAKRTEKKISEKLQQDPESRIQNYLDRFKEIIEREDIDKRERGIQALKKILYNKFVIKENEIPPGFFDNQRRLAREQGHGDIEITDEMKEQLSEVVITDQKSSLDNWIDYLSSEDAIYPDWLKYYSFRSMLNLGEYDKEKKKFNKRSKGTTKPFPDLNREALAYVLDAIEKKQTGDKDESAEEQFEQILKGENFAKLYAWAIDKVTPATQEALSKVEGKWIKYDQNSDHTPLVDSLQGHGTGWCTAGESTAQSQLQGGDFYVYYSYDEDKKPTIPRAAIRMQENQIAEVRGVASEQNLDPYINDVVKEKLTEFSDGKVYENKVDNMKLLTEIDKKTKNNQELDKQDLVFLYEIEDNIQGFGYQTDPRIKEIRDLRNPEQDAPIVFECNPENIAHNKEEINENTKAYVGELFLGIFDKIREHNIEHIYTSFPENKIDIFNAELGNQTKQELIQELEKREQLDEQNKDKIYISNYVKDMLKNEEFFTLENKEQQKFVKLKVKDLGFKNNVTTEQIYNRAKELGLDLCPPETGPKLRLNYGKIFKKEQPLGEYFRIAMKQISDSDGNPRVFFVNRGDDGGSWLHGGWANPGSEWDPSHQFVFSLRKLGT